MGETLKQRFGPLPVWAWALAFVIVLGIYLSLRKNKANAAAAAAAQGSQNNLSSNLGTVPVSNLTTAAQPMPIQMGDTFVNTSTPETINVNPFGGPPSSTLQTAPLPAISPALLLKIGQAENAGSIQAAGGNALTALSNEGLSQQNVKDLASAVSAGGGDFLTENMVAKQAGLPYYTSAGLQPGTSFSYNGTPL